MDEAARTAAARVTAMYAWGADRRVGTSWRRAPAGADVVVVAVLFALSMLFVGLHVHGYTKLGPIDELQHVDSLYQAPDHPEPTDKVGQAALHQQLCRGIDAPGFPPPGCRAGRLDPNTFQERGFNTAASYTPLYYTVTRGVAEAVEVLTPADDLVTAGRLTGGLWLALGVALIYAAGRARGIARAPLATACALAISSPAVVYPSSTIAPDATALAVGGSLLLALTWWEARPSWRRGSVLVLLAVIASAVKMTYLAGVAAVALYLLIRWLRTRRRDRLGTVGLAVATGAFSLAGVLAWTTYVASLPQITEADLPDMATRFKVAAFPWTGLGDSLLVLAQPLSSPWVVVGIPTIAVLSTTIVSVVLTAGVVGAGVFGAAAERERDLARATLLAALLGSAGLVVLAYVTAGSYIPLPARYGMVLVAPIVLATAAAVRSRASLAILAAITAVSLVLAGWRLVALS